MRKLFFATSEVASNPAFLVSDKRGYSQLSFGLVRALFSSSTFAWQPEPEELVLVKQITSVQSDAVKRVHEVFEKIVRERCHNGETLLLINDDEFTRPDRVLRRWQALADDYNYEVIILTDPLVETDLSAYDVEGLRQVSVWDLEKELLIPRIEDKDEVIVIGDVQGCGLALKKLLSEVRNDSLSQYFIFAGDLFDRGQHPIQVLEALKTLPEGSLTLCEGNHERNVIEAFSGLRAPRGSQRSVNQIRGGGKRFIAQAQEILKKTQPLAVFKLDDDKQRYVTHGGVARYVLNAYDVNEPVSASWPNHAYFLGTGNESKLSANRGSYSTFDIERLAQDFENSDFVQYFGHRNKGFTPLKFSNIRPLESDVERGGVLTSVVVSRDGSERVVTVPGEDN